MNLWQQYSKALKYNEKNIKAIYRRAITFLEIDDFSECLKVLIIGWIIKNNSKEINKGMELDPKNGDFLDLKAKFDMKVKFEYSQ